MMKKIIAAMTACILFAACGGSEAAPDAVSDGTRLTENENIRMVYGEISEVIGNAVIIKEIEPPQRSAFSLPDGMTEITLPDGTVIPFGEDGFPDVSGWELPEGLTPGMIQERRGGFRPGDGEIPEGGFFGGEIPDGMRDTIRGVMGMVPREHNYTGEEMEIIIPVGIPVMTMARGESGPEERELGLNQLKSGDLITITYNDNETISTVFVSQSGMGMMMPGGLGREIFGFDAAQPVPGGGMIIQRIP
jgi:hypothetical protein